jgi:outer membrane receptor protein involved in Fe transport
LFSGDLPYTNFENRAGNIGAGYRGDWGKIELRASRYESQQNFLGAMSASGNPYLPEPTGQLLTNDEYQLSGQVNLAQGWALKPQYMHTRYQRQAITSGTYSQLSSSKGSDKYLDILVQRDELKLGLQHPKIGLFKGELGVEWMDKQQDLLAGKLAPNASESGQAIYLFEEAKAGQWTWNMGLRHDWRQMKAPLEGNSYFVNTGIFDATNNDKSLENSSASLGMVYALTPQWNLATNIGTGFRAPSIFERYAGGIHGGVQAFQLGNPDLKAETSLNTDVSLRFMGDVTTLNATVYQNWVDNYIYLMNTGQVRNTANGTLTEMRNAQTDAIIRGLEVSGTWDVTRKLMLESALEVIESEDTKNQRSLSLMPANNLLLKAHYTLGNLGHWQENRVSLGARLVDRKSAVAPWEPFSQYDTLSTGTASTDAYAVWDVAYRTHYKVSAQQQLTLMANIDNLFDTAYYDFLDTYKGYAMSMGRNARLTAKLEF